MIETNENACVNPSKNQNSCILSSFIYNAIILNGNAKNSHCNMSVQRNFFFFPREVNHSKLFFFFFCRVVKEIINKKFSS